MCILRAFVSYCQCYLHIYLKVAIWKSSLLQKKTAPGISRVHNGFIIVIFPNQNVPALVYRPCVHRAIIGIIITTNYIWIKFQQEPHPPLPSACQLHHHWLVLWVAQRCSTWGSWEVLGWTGHGLPGGGEACTHIHIFMCEHLHWCLFKTVMHSHTWIYSPNICKFN